MARIGALIPEYLCWQCLLVLLQVFFNLRKASLQHFLPQLPLVLRPRPGELTAPSVRGLQSLLLALRFFGATVVLFIPTFLMGGTLPILVRGITRNSAELGIRVSQLYWVNTLGAVAGTLISGFVLRPASDPCLRRGSQYPCGSDRPADRERAEQPARRKGLTLNRDFRNCGAATTYICLPAFSVCRRWWHGICVRDCLDAAPGDHDQQFHIRVDTNARDVSCGHCHWQRIFPALLRKLRAGLTYHVLPDASLDRNRSTYFLVLDRLRESTPNESRISKAFIYDIQF
jgi:hypothetical protein